MKKQLAFTLLLSAIIGANVFAQDAPKPAGKKKDNKVKALPQAPQAAPTQPVVNGAQPAQQTGQLAPAPAKPATPAAPGAADANHPKAQATHAPMQEKIAKPEVEPKK